MIKLITVLAIFAAFTAFSFIVYKREPLATLAEWFLWVRGKREFTNDAACDRYLKRRRKLNEMHEHIPLIMRVLTHVRDGEFEGMTYFVLNRQKRPDNLVFYFHGGAYVHRMSINHWLMLARIAAFGGAQVVVPIYLKAPNHTASESYKILEDFYIEYTKKAGHKAAAFVGDSAGGGMAIALAQRLRDRGERIPENIIALSPWVDISLDNEEMKAYEKIDPMLGIRGLKRIGKIWAGELDTKDPRISPIYGSFEGIGHLTIFVGTREIIYPDAMRLKSIMEENGIRFTLIVGRGMNHVWPIYPMPEGVAAVRKIEKIIKTRRD